MGCLIEFIFEIVCESVIYAYTELMCLILPQHRLSHKADRILRTAVIIFTAILLFAMVAGIIMLLQTDPHIKSVGYYLTFIPLGLTVIQIAAGIIVRAKTKK